MKQGHAKGTAVVCIDEVHIKSEHRLNAVFIMHHLAMERDRVIHAERITALWNASDGMTNDEAVRYLEHGKRALIHLKEYKLMLAEMIPADDDFEREAHDNGLLNLLDDLITLMEGK